MDDRKLKQWEDMEREWTVPALLDALEAEGPLSLQERLKELLPILQRHFELEEEPGGFFDELIELDPGTAQRVVDLRDDHVHIVEMLEALIDPIEHDGHPPEKLRESRALLATKIRAHQRVEFALLQEAVLRDTGVAD